MLKVVNAVIIIYLLAPILVVVATAFTTTAYPVFPPEGFTFRWFEKFLGSREFVESIKVSALLATTSTLVAAILGTSSAIALTRFPIPGKALISALLLSPILFPTIVLGLALLVFSTRIGLSGTFLNAKA